MIEKSTADTSGSGIAGDTSTGLTQFQQLLATSALLLCRLAAESVAAGATRCFVEHRTETTPGFAGSTESSTKLPEVSPEIKVDLDRLWEQARNQVIEDGMENAITERLAGLIARDFHVVIPAIIASIEGAKVAPVVSAEVFKELGRLRDPGSHAIRKWALAHGLDNSSPVVRDGAGLGLARMADPTTLEYLWRAIRRETDPQMNVNLQLVADEIEQTTH